MLRVLGASLAFNSEKSMLLSRLPSIRRHPMPCPNSSGGDALEHTQYGQGFGRQQSNGMPGYGNSTISSHILSRHSNSVATSSLSGNFKISLGYISIRQTKHWSCVSTKRVRSKRSEERNFYYLYAQAFRRVRHTIIHGTERQLYSLP